MTNVPDSIREMWREVYILFDTNWKMDNSEEAWKKFWDAANEMLKKYDVPRLMDLITVVAEMIGDHVKCITEKMPTWKPDEPYPYPKGDYTSGDKKETAV